MSQAPLTFTQTTGAEFVAFTETALKALASTSKGATRPQEVQEGQFWIDDTDPNLWLLKQFANSQDIVAGSVDPINQTFTPYSNGQPLLPPAASWEVIGSVSAAGAADVKITWTKPYRHVRVMISNLLPSLRAMFLLLRTSSNGGLSYDAGPADYPYFVMMDHIDVTNVAGSAVLALSRTGSISAGNTFTALSITSGDPKFLLGNGSNDQVSAILDLFQPSDISVPTLIRSVLDGPTAGVDPIDPVINNDLFRQQTTVNGRRNIAAKVDSIQIRFSGSTIASGDFLVMGVT